MFQPGDEIVIKEVRSSLGTLAKGDTVTVKGTYTLASQPNARLGFYITQDSRDAPDHYTPPGTTRPIHAGSASFEITRPITCNGHLHFGLYDVQKGNSFGNVYFGTEAQMREIAHWNLESWSRPAPVITAIPASPSAPPYPVKVSEEDLASQTEFSQDAKLNGVQRRFRDQCEQRNLSVFNPIEQARLQALTAEERIAEEKAWIEQLAATEGREQGIAVNALAQLGSKQAIPELLKIATDRSESDPRPRWMAARALGVIGEASVVPELVHLTYHYDRDTQLWAQISLVRLTGENFTDDLPAWRRWWRQQGGTPPISDQVVPWAATVKDAFTPSAYPIIGGSGLCSPPEAMAESYHSISQFTDEAYTFRVVPGTWTVERLDVAVYRNKSSGGSRADFSIWSDVAGRPGEKLATFVVTDIKTYGRVYSVMRSFSPVQLDGDKTYWLSGSADNGYVNWNLDNNVFNVLRAYRKNGGPWIVQSSGNISAFTVYGSPIAESSE